MQNYFAGGHGHACNVRTTGDIRCLGLGAEGQLGTGSLATDALPAVVSGLSGTPIAVVAGVDHTCALTSAAALYCWGDNGGGDLGNGSTTLSDVAVAVSGLGSPVVAMTAGHSHTCAVLGTGTVDCWGSNTEGQVGNGTTGISETSPQAVSGLSGVTGIAGGGYHTCAVRSDGSVWCWGSNSSGQLGTTSVTISESPIEVAAVSGAVSVVTGATHTCVLTSAGSVWCWGDNADGEAGNGTTSATALPAAIPSSGFGGETVTAISAAAAGFHTCALTSAGTVFCWGDNGDGQLANPTIPYSSSPVQVSSISGATELMTEDTGSCVLVTSVGVMCWGADSDGQLGNGLLEPSSSTPVAGSYL
jgi:alpha-tubulin suppressor-like RCC1 family protein